MKWIEDFAAFPAGKNDHDVDACTQALRRLFPMGVIKLMDYQPARIHA
jgi:phage terminase large subunit-like protein